MMGICQRNLEEALEEFSPDIVVYNAGTDILDGDQLGMLSVSSKVGICCSFGVFVHCFQCLLHFDQLIIFRAVEIND